jgi:hypothetical protein
MTKIGVTGHRFLADTEKLIQSVDKALGVIEEQFEPPYILLSPLAEGADRLVPYRAFARWHSARLVVSLPLDVEEYMEDFKTLTSKADFINLAEMADQFLQPTGGIDREDAYQAAGFRVIDLCDVLIAVWDGLKTQGKGGTAEMVARAREKKTPVIWIHAGNRMPGSTSPISLSEEQGKLTLENFKHS